MAGNTRQKRNDALVSEQQLGEGTAVDDRLGRVKDALYDAAVSGNVPAMQEWTSLNQRDKPTLAPGSQIGVTERIERLRRIHPHSAPYQAIVEYRRKYVALLKLEGRTAHGVCEGMAELGILNPNTREPYSICTVRQDIEAIRDAWRQDALIDWERHQAEELAVIHSVRLKGFESGDWDLVLKTVDRKVRLMGLDARSVIDQQLELRRQQMANLLEQFVVLALDKIKDPHDRLLVLTEAEKHLINVRDSDDAEPQSQRMEIESNRLDPSEI